MKVENTKIITVEECIELKNKFDKYCKIAEQHEFVKLAMIQMPLETTIARIKEDNEVKDQKDIRAMFRVVLSVIGQYYSEYLEYVDGD